MALAEGPGGKTGKSGNGDGRRRTRRGEVQEKVLATIRHGLMIGAYVPGQVMSLRNLAQSFDVSPMPVREALSQLVAANVLEAMPNRSVRVPRMTEKRLRELSEVRVAVECIAAKAACENATPDLVKTLERINAKLTAGIERRDILACLQSNQQFHFTLYESAGSEVLGPVIESLWLQCGPTLYFSLVSPEFPWDASAHDEVLQALRDKDASAAQKGIGRDIRTTLKNLLNGPMLRGNAGLFANPMDEFRISLMRQDTP